MARAKSKTAPEAEAPVIHGIKGFDTKLQCRGFQFTVGETFTHEGRVVACKSGFHAVTDHPLAVFGYYAPASSRFCRVEMSGETDTDDNVKTAASILKVGQEIGLRELTLDAVKWVMDRAKPEGEVAKGANGLATASGYQGAATASGTRGAATASGTQGAATASGTQGAATASGDQGAATASGDQGAATASGTRGAATASGYQGAATASGYLGCVSGATGNALFAVERATWDGPIISVACGIVGQDGIEPDIQYRAVAGKLVAA